MAKKASKTKVRKSARKQAKKQAKRPLKRAAQPKAKASKALKKKAKTVAPKARKGAKPAKKAPARAARVMARKAVKRTAGKAAKPKPPASAKPKQMAAPKPKPALAAPKKMPILPPPALQRERRRLPEAEQESFSETSEDSRLMSSARAGHDDLRSELKQHTETSPEMTAGDVDAKWQDAYALGDEAPGGDNMTPDQDRVDDIGKALGIEYADDEELLGGDEIAERDEHRWELDPASKDEDEDL